MAVESIEASVQYGDLKGEALADWSADFGKGRHSLLQALGLDLEGYYPAVVYVWAGENSWGDRSPGIYLTIYAAPQEGATGVDVVKIMTKISPLKFFWLFKRFSLSIKEREWRGCDELDVASTISI